MEEWSFEFETEYGVIKVGVEELKTGIARGYIVSKTYKNEEWSDEIITVANADGVRAIYSCVSDANDELWYEENGTTLEVLDEFRETTYDAVTPASILTLKMLEVEADHDPYLKEIYEKLLQKEEFKQLLENYEELYKEFQEV